MFFFQAVFFSTFTIISIYYFRSWDLPQVSSSLLLINNLRCIAKILLSSHIPFLSQYFSSFDSLQDLILWSFLLVFSVSFFVFISLLYSEPYFTCLSWLLLVISIIYISNFNNIFYFFSIVHFIYLASLSIWCILSAAPLFFHLLSISMFSIHKNILDQFVINHYSFSQSLPNFFYLITHTCSITTIAFFLSSLTRASLLLFFRSVHPKYLNFFTFSNSLFLHFRILSLFFFSLVQRTFLRSLYNQQHIFLC